MGPVENNLHTKQTIGLEGDPGIHIIKIYIDIGCLLTWRVSDHVCPLIAFTICRWEAEKLCPAPRLATTASGLWVW